MAKFDELLARLETKGNTPTEEVFLTSDQMERLLCCSKSTLYRLRTSKAIPCIKIRGQYRYPKNYFTEEMIKTIVKGEDSSKRFDDQ